MATLRRVRPLAGRFWEKVEKTETCWLWAGPRTANGYGVIHLGRRGEGHAYAHRLSFEWAYGPIPPGMHVCHRCDVRNCVNPAHLFRGSPAENMADMHAKGRQADPQTTRRSGEANGRARLDRERVTAIRSAHTDGASIYSLAKRFGVGETTVRNIVKGRRWTDAVVPVHPQPR